MGTPMPPLPQVRMPTGAPTMWPPPPPPPPCHAPPVVPPDAQPGDESLVQEIIPSVVQRISPMLAAAARTSESQVSTEIRKLDVAFASLQAKISRVEALLRAHEQRVHMDYLSRLLADVERRWETEIKAVKRELHQTILAHNHNADLMADHKTAIDRIRADVDAQGPFPQLESEVQLREQLQRLSQTLEHNRAQEQDIDALLRRGEVLMQQLGCLPPMAAGAW
mmetsp:Transcript_189/g.409  ORF Transcript_189/g.409 Transcript_189/m.409 type:complete len:223 (-) Transcript_189:46-714(-)